MVLLDDGTCRGSGVGESCGGDPFWWVVVQFSIYWSVVDIFWKGNKIIKQGGLAMSE